ncbi:ABC transporter ATP-binding protein [Xanthobacter agilis]|uniref:ABC transporter ATP-binding protein n=1 Tax=Xanthobacter agilis TaxID=47492 RepID=UPI003729B75E
MTQTAIETPLTPTEPEGPAKLGHAIWSAVWTPYRAAVGVLIVCQIMQSLAALVLPSLSASVIDLGILRNDVPYIAEMSAAMLGAAMVQIAFAVGAAWFGARIAMGVGRDLRSAVFARVQIFSLHEMRRFGAPSLITRTTNDVQQVQAFLVMALTMIISAPITGIGGVVMAVRQDGQLSLLLAISVPLLALLVGVLMALALPLYARMQGQIDRINQILREQITGLRVIRAFVRDGHERSRFGSANDEMTETALRVGRLMALNMPVAHLIMQLSSIAMVWFAAQRIAAGTLEVGALVAFLSYIMQILISVMIASMLFVMAPRALVSARRIEEVLQTPSSVAEPQTPSALPDPASHGVEIEFCNVTFAYPGAEQPVLSDVSFRVGPGQTVGVIGATGAGKSTIVNLIVRLFDVTGGAVRVNGIDIRNLALETLWSLIGLVPQESYLFSGTVAENLRYGRTEATDDELWHALDVAQAKDLVLGLPKGLDAPVVQGGGNFSGGQRQRLAIARALVRRAPVYLFDDSFSALDYVTEARLRLAFSKEAAAAATLIVGQRVNALRDADTILLLEHGAIAAAGSHDELMKASAAYRDIVASQQVGEGVTEEGPP